MKQYVVFERESFDNLSHFQRHFVVRSTLNIIARLIGNTKLTLRARTQVRRIQDGRFLSGKNRTDIIERFVSAIWFVIIILVLILPILFFSNVNPLTASNEVTRATAKISIVTDREIGATMFELYSVENAFSISPISSSEFATLRSSVPRLPASFSDRTQAVRVMFITL